VWKGIRRRGGVLVPALAVTVIMIDDRAGPMLLAVVANAWDGQ
jgi:hypothetical protein